jgi:hypothetical protein
MKDPVGYGSTWPGLYICLSYLQDLILYLSSKPPRLWASWPMPLGRVGRLWVDPHVPLGRVQETWYPWYQTSSGLTQTFQLTRQWPPLTFSKSWPLHKKLFLNLSILYIPILTLWRQRGSMWVERTTLIWLEFPCLDRRKKILFESGSLSPIFWIIWWNNDLGNFLTCSGKPR